MNTTIAYCKPNITVLGGVVKMICATLIKSHIGIIEAVQWRILPAYDLDE